MICGRDKSVELCYCMVELMWRDTVKIPRYEMERIKKRTPDSTCIGLSSRPIDACQRNRVCRSQCEKRIHGTMSDSHELLISLQLAQHRSYSDIRDTRQMKRISRYCISRSALKSTFEPKKQMRHATLLMVETQGSKQTEPHLLPASRIPSYCTSLRRTCREPNCLG